ncbi:light and redox sensing histidine kinase [Haloarcula hispanica N601]|uniref:histidine kinase n=2 Tax=Haloarcula hispanica TaxID=51589 RepID=V5TQE0_HALHI|nr:PAS domain S-box protein [Haloarcula hispanica]AEM58428.1 putative light and redox sensing histidine kinase [Haloarcula hispanica ATCC 33960]AHB67152.1 light and redox sensing histidine kinase [Haloarcula hispanica N601]
MTEALRGRHLDGETDVVGERIQVLHIDDDPDFVAVAADSLEAADDRISVETATSARDGLDQLAENGFDAVVSDYDMPKMNGIDLLDAIRETNPDLPFILFTGKGSEEVASEAISMGVTDYLQKSFGVEVYELLANRIENAVSEYRAKRQAAESERRVRELTEATNDILWEFTADLSEVLVINSAYEDIWGRSVAKLRDNPYDFLNGIHPEDRELMKDAMRRLMHGESADVECRVNATEEYQRWVWIQGEPITNDDGEVVRVAGFARDITERRNRERELEATKNQLTEHNQTLRKLYEISADPDASFEEKIQAVLDLGRERLGTAGAFLSANDTDRDEFTVRYASGSDERLKPGTVTPLSEAYCRKMIDTGSVMAIAEASDEGWASDPAYDRWEYETYISAEVRVRDAHSGSLCFVDREARKTPFTEDEKTFVHLATQWVSYELERQQREQRLERYKEYTDDMLDAIDDVFYVLDSDGRFRRWNESLLNVTGYSDAEVAGTHGADFFPEEHQDLVAAAIESVFEGDTTRVEVPFITKSGDQIPHEFTATRVEDPDGNPMLAGIGRDITERKAREQELTRTKELLDQAQRIASVGGWEIDVTSEPPEMTVTSEFYRIHGLTPDDELSVESIVDLYHPDDRETVMTEFHRAIETAEGYDMEVRIGDDDHDRWVRALCEPVTENGDVVKLRGSVQDITDRKLRERELEEARERMEIALETTNTVVWDREFESGGLSYYPGSETLYGTDIESLDEFLPLVHPEDQSEVAARIESATETGTYEAEFRIVRDGEVRWMEAKGRVESDSDGTPVRAIGIDRDITERKRREQELEDTNERLEEFTSIVSHDLRNPLSVAEGRIELAQQEYDSEHLDSASDALARMRTLIDDLLAAARDEQSAVDAGVVALTDTAEQCWHNVETNDAELTVETDAVVRADRSRLEQLLENLFSNSVEHGSTSSRPGADDSVEHGGDDVTVTVGELDDGFYVEDDGDGIDESERSRVFETGYSTSDAGTGFGLWIVAEIADAHGWTVTIDEGNEGGARFEITGVDVVE